MSREFGMKASRKTSKRMSEDGFDLELPSKLTIKGFDNLPKMIEEISHGAGDLGELIPSGKSKQTNVSLVPEALRDLCTNIALISSNHEIVLPREEFLSHHQIGAMGRSNLKIQDQPRESR